MPIKIDDCQFSDCGIVFSVDPTVDITITGTQFKRIGKLVETKFKNEMPQEILDDFSNYLTNGGLKDINSISRQDVDAAIQNSSVKGWAKANGIDLANLTISILGFIFK